MNKIIDKIVDNERTSLEFKSAKSLGKSLQAVRDEYKIPLLLEVTSPIIGNIVNLNYVIEEYKGKIVNFCGMNIETENLNVVIGSSEWKREYIPIINLLDFFNIYLIGSNDKIVDKQTLLYLIESFKIDFIHTSIIGVIEENTRDLSGSAVFDLIDEVNSERSGKRDDFLTGYNDNMLYEELLGISVKVRKILRDLCALLYGKCQFEKGIENFLTGVGREYKKSIERFNGCVLALYIDRVVHKDFSESLMYDAYTYLFGESINKIGKYRNFVYLSMYEGGEDTKKILAALSCDFRGGEDIEKVDDKDIISFNLLDLIRTDGGEEDLFIGVDLLSSDKRILTDVIDKYGFKGIIRYIGIERFISNLSSFRDEYLKRVLRYGGSRLDKDLVNCSAVGESSIAYGGLLSEKILNIIESKFY